MALARVTSSFPTLGAVAATLLLALPAAAQTTTAQKATAEAYFDDALRLMRAGTYAEACAKLEASQRLDPAVGTLLYLGECYEKRGRTASAWVTFRDAEALARATTQPQRAEMARVHAEKLQASLSHVTVELSSEARATSGLQVRCGSVPIDPTLPAGAVPVDPGEVVVEASAPGYATLSRSVLVPAGGKVTVTIPALTRQAAPPAPTAPAPAPTPLGTSPAPAPSLPPPQATEASVGAPPAAAVAVPSPQPPSLAWPIALGAVGIVGLSVGSVLGVKAINNASEASGLCPNNQCTQQRGETLMNSARHQAQISNVAFALGAAGLAAGIIVYVLDRPKKPEQGLALSPWLGPTQGGIALRGRL
jgi:serine/threonine-protein kinase